MPRIYCECGRRAICFRRVRARGKWNGRIKVFSDSRHSLCVRHNNELRESIYQTGKFFNFQGTGGRITDLKLHPAGLTESLFSALQQSEV